MVLGTLATHGPQHGHQIRLIAEVTNVGEWGGVSVGALYRELKLMAVEGLVTELRTEQVGRRPARTIYEITREGRMGLSSLRERAIKDVHPSPDPIGVALAFAGDGGDIEELTGWMRTRQDFLEVVLREQISERERLLSKGYLTPLQAASMRRGELTIRGELLWHEELSQVLAELAAARPPAPKGLNGTGGTSPAPLAPGEEGR